MFELYHLPTIVVLTIIAGVFGALYQRNRAAKTLLWMIAWWLIVVRVVCSAANGAGNPRLLELIGRCCLLCGAAMFTGSLSPLKFRKTKMLYVVLFAVPTLFYCALTAWFPVSPLPLRVVEVLLVGAAVTVVTLWGAEKNLIPRWYSLPLPVITGTVCLYEAALGNTAQVLGIVQAVLYLNTALLFLAAFRGWSAGKLVTIASFLFWSGLNAYGLLPWEAPHQTPMTAKLINLCRMAAALGMVILVLEEELRKNTQAQAREHQVRSELERFAALHTWIAPGEMPGRLCQEVAEAIQAVTRFSQVAIFLRGLKQDFQVVATAGMDGALAGALAALGGRLRPAMLEAGWAAEGVQPMGGAGREMDLTQWYMPGDELGQLGCRSLIALPMRTQGGQLEGFIGLAGIRRGVRDGVRNGTRDGEREGERALLADDLLPSQTLAGRLAMAVEYSALGQRLMRSEKLASIGQLAGGVAHELNNPLTVVMGYSELIEELAGDESTRRNAAIIRSESLRMKHIIDALIRFGRPVPQGHQPTDIGLLLGDIERLRQSDLRRNGIELEMTITGTLPPVVANADQLRQVFLQVLHNAEDVLQQDGVLERRIRVDASCQEDKIRILFSDSGTGFAAPGRVFDPFFTTKQPGHGTGLGLSVCYSILRDHGGEISAFNLHPTGGAVMIELPTHSAVLAEPIGENDTVSSLK